MHFRASDVASATGGTLFGPDVALEGVSFDSRSIRPGQLFVPIVADRDGHHFIASALSAGAGAYLTQRAPNRGSAIVVADTAEALMQLGGWGRAKLSGPVVGITGSVGKTSTKDLTRAALAAGLRTAANERSYNNELGVPVTILNAPEDTEALVLEMGMRGFGEIARLCAVGRPTIGVVTRVAAAHTQRVGGLEGVARAKAELIESLAADGLAILNADDLVVAAMSASVNSAAAVMTYGRSPGADVRISDLRLDDRARARFVVTSPWGAADVSLTVSGSHMAGNAAAALAVACSCGVDLAAAAAALATARLSPARMDVGRNRRGVIVINDAYNANPDSMRAAVEALVAFEVAGRRVAMLGVMAELADPATGHGEIAALLDVLGVELVAVGTNLYGVEPSDDPVAAVDSLTDGDVLLIKGSLVAGMERFAAVVLAQ